jgi:membrane-associated phospholipid phosphatase
MKSWFVVLALSLAGVVHAAPAEGPETGIERSADALLVGIPVAAFGLTYLLQNGDGQAVGYDLMHMTGSPRHDLSLALVRAGAVTYGLKYSVDETRPNGGEGSFPSGHTAVTFAGAEFIRKQYGWKWGAPAYAAASFVGWSRVHTDDHWTHDVLVGALIGFSSNYDLGSLDGRWGGMQLKPALFQSGYAPLPGMQFESEVPASVPGLKLEFRF